MHLLFYYPSLKLGGQQTQTLELIRNLNKEFNCKITLFYNLEGQLKADFEEFATVHKISSGYYSKIYYKDPRYLFKNIYYISRYLKFNRVDGIISGNGIGSLICGIASRLINITHFRLIGCSLKQVEKTLYKYYRLIPFKYLIDGYFGWQAVFEELLAKGESKNKLIHIPPAVNTEKFYPLKSLTIKEKKKILNIPKDRIVIGWVGRIAENMQIHNTLLTCKRLVEIGYTDFHILIVGGGDWVDNMYKCLDEYNLGDIYTHTGWVPLEEVNSYLNCMDIVPLLEEDPQGGSIVREAMAAGKVALSVNGTSGTQSEFMKKNNSILVPPSDFINQAAIQIIHLANNEAIIKTIGKQAREYAKKNMSFYKQAEIIYKSVKGN